MLLHRMLPIFFKFSCCFAFKPKHLLKRVRSTLYFPFSQVTVSDPLLQRGLYVLGPQYLVEVNGFRIYMAIEVLLTAERLLTP